jgi:hypothetical protein
MFGFFACAKELVPETAKATMTSPHNSCFDFHKFELVCYLWLGRVTH